MCVESTNMMQVYIICFTALMITPSVASSNIVSDCGPKDAWIRFNKVEASPQPIIFDNVVNISLDIDVLRSIGNNVAISVVTKKSNLPGYEWEIPCGGFGTEIPGVFGENVPAYIGTCDYRNICDRSKYLRGWADGQDVACPAPFQLFGVSCRECPLPPQKIANRKVVSVDLNNVKDSLPNWLLEGGYRVRIKLTDTSNNDKLVGCMDMKFDVIFRKPCPDVLRRLNACPPYDSDIVGY